MRGRVLIVAGSDSGGGAGIQADVKTVTAMGGFAATAVTALTAQNTLGVHGVLPVPPAFVVDQMRAVLDDLGADALKTGMLHDVPVIEAVTRVIEERCRGVPLVADPVLVAKGGARLLEDRARGALVDRLLPLATIVTPNAPEAEVLAGVPVRDRDGQRRAAERLLALGARAVLVKGGHLPGPQVADLLVTPQGERLLVHERVDTTSTHGTGCTLASAIAAGLAAGRPLEDAVVDARAYVLAAIRAAPGLGRGAGPLDHGWPFRAGRAPSA